VHWGIGLSADEAVGLAALKNRPVPNGSFDDEDPLEVVPTRSGYIGVRPGLEGRRADGSSWAPQFGEATHAADVSTQATTGKVGLTVAAMDSTNQLALATEFVLDGFDVLTVRTTLTNTAPSSASHGEAPGTHSHFALLRLQVCLPLSSTTDEVLDFPGRWVKEGQPQRRRLGIGALSWDNRRGRHSHQNSPGLFAGTPNFTERSGELVGIHIAWSGAHEMRVERGIDGRVCLQAGVLLDAGEVDLAPGESFTTPWVMATWSGEGLSAASSSFHSELDHSIPVLRGQFCSTLGRRSISITIWKPSARLLIQLQPWGSNVTYSMMAGLAVVDMIVPGWAIGGFLPTHTPKASTHSFPMFANWVWSLGCGLNQRWSTLIVTSTGLTPIGFSPHPAWISRWLAPNTFSISLILR
jgi:Glycosyl hydrolase family 36 N-terminal domain